MELRAFVAEDNPVILENLIGTLEEMTCVSVVGSASRELEAAQWLEANALEWDLLIVDLVLQSGNGLRLIETTHRQLRAQKIVVFSNHLDSAIRKHCARLGADAVFDKSTEMDALVDYCARRCFGSTVY